MNKTIKRWFIVILVLMIIFSACILWISSWLIVKSINDTSFYQPKTIAFEPFAIISGANIADAVPQLAEERYAQIGDDFRDQYTDCREIADERDKAYIEKTLGITLPPMNLPLEYDVREIKDLLSVPEVYYLISIGRPILSLFYIPAQRYSQADNGAYYFDYFDKTDSSAKLGEAYSPDKVFLYTVKGRNSGLRAFQNCGFNTPNNEYDLLFYIHGEVPEGEKEEAFLLNTPPLSKKDQQLFNQATTAMPKKITSDTLVPISAWENHMELMQLVHRWIAPINEVTYGMLWEYTGFISLREPMEQLPDIICEFKNIRSFQAEGVGLTSLPQNFTNLKGLRYLNIASNHLTVLPERIGEMENLTMIGLRNNDITALPESIGTLSGLRGLDVGGNELTALPENIAGCKELREIYVFRNQLTQFPPAFTQLKRLKVLYLGNNQIKSLPEDINFLESLEELYVYSNELEALPETICTLPKLYVIDADNNQLSSLPENIGALEYAQINVNYNRIQRLPKSICDLAEMSFIEARNNPIIAPPDEWIASPSPMPLYLDVFNAHYRDVQEFFYEKYSNDYRSMERNFKDKQNFIAELMSKQDSSPSFAEYQAEHKMPSEILIGSATTNRKAEKKEVPKEQDAVIWHDTMLEFAVREYLGKPEGEILCGELDDIKVMIFYGNDTIRFGGLTDHDATEVQFSDNERIVSLEDLIYFRQIRQLDFINLEINDYSPLWNMNALTSVSVVFREAYPIDNFYATIKNQTVTRMELIGAFSVIDLTKLEGLQELYINSVIPPKELFLPKSLKTLSMQNCQLESTEIVPPMEHLVELNLSNNQISDIKSLAKIKSLKKLYLDRNLICNVEALGKITSLEELSLDYNNIRSLEPLVSLDRLSEIFVRQKTGKTPGAEEHPQLAGLKETLKIM